MAAPACPGNVPLIDMGRRIIGFFRTMGIVAVTAGGSLQIAGGKRCSMDARSITCHKSCRNADLPQDFGIIQVAFQACLGYFCPGERRFFALHRNYVVCTVTANAGRRQARTGGQSRAMIRSQEFLLFFRVARGAGARDIDPVGGGLGIAGGANFVRSMAGFAFCCQSVNACIEACNFVTGLTLDGFYGFRMRYVARFESDMAVNTSHRGMD